MESNGPFPNTKTDLECVRSVLYVTVARLLPDTDGVVLVGQMLSPGKVVALESSSHSCEPLSAPWLGPPPRTTLQLAELELLK